MAEEIVSVGFRIGQARQKVQMSRIYDQPAVAANFLKMLVGPIIFVDPHTERTQRFHSTVSEEYGAVFHRIRHEVDEKLIMVAA